MELNIEKLGALERRLDINISIEKLQAEVENRIKKLAKTTKLHGFRPGKVPLKMVSQMYGAQVQQDALNDAVHKQFVDTIKELNVQVAGYPQFEAKPGTNEAFYSFSATFEIYPEIVVGDLSQQNIEKPNVKIGDADIDKTLNMIRRQRAKYEPVSRSAKENDRVRIDYTGTIDGAGFEGGTASDVQLVIGDVAQSYDNPEQVIKWHYASSERLQEAESLALEENVVNWALNKVNVVDKAVTFDELMGIS